MTSSFFQKTNNKQLTFLPPWSVNESPRNLAGRFLIDRSLSVGVLDSDADGGVLMSCPPEVSTVNSSPGDLLSPASENRVRSEARELLPLVFIPADDDVVVAPKSTLFRVGRMIERSGVLAF